MQMSIFVCGKQTEEFSQLVEILPSFIILFVENPTERGINQSTDGARSVLGNKLLQKVQRFWGSVKRRFIGHDIPGAVTVLSGTEPIVP